MARRDNYPIGNMMPSPVADLITHADYTNVRRNQFSMHSFPYIKKTIYFKFRTQKQLKRSFFSPSLRITRRLQTCHVELRRCKKQKAKRC